MQITRLGGSWEAPSVSFFNQLGAGSVALFFMTTGFVFYPRVLMGFNASHWVAIYTGRLFRIIPLVGVSLAIITCIIAIRTGRSLDYKFLTPALKWVTSWGEPPLLGYEDSGRLNAYVLWSLWYEWLFYLLVLPACAFAIDLMRNKVPTWTVPVLLIAMPLTASALQIPGSSTGLVPYLPLFGTGMLAYECQARRRLAEILCWPTLGVAAAFALAVGMRFWPTPYGVAMPLFGLFFICVACGNGLGGLLRTSGALVLGECSYGIYLLHGVILSLLFVEADSVVSELETMWLPLLLPFAAFAVVLLAAATFLLFERPAIFAGKRFAKRWTRNRIAAAAEAEVAP
jgi:peptidoglycan/LPS O-acetylase OafA/YrhL